MSSFGFRLRGATRYALWLLLLVLTGMVARAQSLEVAGTLPEDYLPGLKPILEAALKQSPQMLLREIQISRMEARVYDADRLRWPNVGGDIRYDSNRTGVSGNSTTQSRDSGLFYSLSASEEIFHWGEIKHRGEIARLEVAMSQRDFAEGFRLLAVQLRQTYVGLVKRNAYLQQLRYELGLKRARLETANERLKYGQAAPGEAAVAELDYNEAELRADQFQADFEGELRRLSRLAGIAPIPADQIPTQLPVPRFDRAMAAEMLAALLRNGANNTFKAQVAELHIKEADLNYRIARVRLLPKFGTSIGHTRESSTTATPNQVSQTAITRDTIELRGNWTIFDGFATKGAKLEAKAEKRYWERQRQIDAETAMDEAQQLERALGLDARAMNFAEQRRLGAEGWVKRAEEELKTGNASPSDVKSALNTLRVAEANAAITRATFLNDWSAFASLVGEDPVLIHLPSRYVRANR